MGDLDNIKVGDAVCIRVRFGWSSFRLQKGVVEKVTETQITAFGGQRFAKRSGKQIGYGGTFHVPHLMRLTDKLLAEEDQEKRGYEAEQLCKSASEILSRARGEEAIELAALLTGKLLPEAPK